MNRAAIDARTVNRYVRNIQKVWDDTPELTRVAGCKWYPLESQRCADFASRYGLNKRDIAGAAAAISPGMRWDSVFAHVAALIRDPDSKVPTYNREFVRRAVRCLRGEDPDKVLSGDKVRAFYALLNKPDGLEVVIDGHAMNICNAKRVPLRGEVPAAARVTERRYRLAVRAYRYMAESLAMPASMLQAATWIHWRAQA